MPCDVSRVSETIRTTDRGRAACLLQAVNEGSGEVERVHELDDAETAKQVGTKAADRRCFDSVHNTVHVGLRGCEDSMSAVYSVVMPEEV